MRRLALDLIRVTPARPAWMAGARAGVAAALPLLLWAELPLVVVSWLSLGAFQAALADRGGAHATRARRMAAVAICSGTACFLGSLIAGSLAASLVVTVLLLFASGLAQVGGPSAAGTGRAAVVAFLVAQARPAASLSQNLEHVLALVVGVLGTMVLALLLWPVHVYRPARRAIGRVLGSLAEHAHLVGQGPPADTWAMRTIHEQRAAVRRTIEEARQVLAATRRGRQAEGERGEKLLRILENADQVLGVLIAIDGWMEGADPALRSQMERALADVERGAQAIADRLGGNQRGALQAVEIPSVEDPVAARYLARISNHLNAAIETANADHEGQPAPAPIAPPLEPPATPLSLREILGGAFDVHSVTLRHALRLALAGGAATVAVSLLEVEQGYWITLAVVVVLQPWTHATVQRGLQRVVGTALGGGLAVLALDWASSPLGYAGVVFAFCFASVALLPLSYGVFSVLLTPAFILLAELATGNFGLAWVRVLDTAIGGGIALLAALVLWPRWERQRFPDELAKALRMAAAWLRAQAAAGPESLEAEQARRKAGIAVMNAEASLRRLIAEPRRPGGDLESLLVLAVYLRRIHATALAVATGEGDSALGKKPADLAADFLDGLAGCVAEGRPPDLAGELAAFDALAESGGEGVSRLARQLAIVHDAAARGFAGGTFHR